jgi:hypothetical protein
MSICVLTRVCSQADTRHIVCLEVSGVVSISVSTGMDLVVSSLFLPPPTPAASKGSLHISSTDPCYHSTPLRRELATAYAEILLDLDSFLPFFFFFFVLY